MNRSARRGVGLVLIGISTVLIKYVVNQKLKHFDDIIFREPLVESEWIFLHDKSCPSLTLKDHDK